MYSTIEKVVVNDKSYHIHKEVLKQFHYFATILKGNFTEKTIEINIDENIDFTKIIDTMYKYYHSKDSNINYFNALTFSEFINVFSFLEYLQPISENHNDMSGMLYEIIRNYTKCIDVNNITINDIKSLNISDQYKKLLFAYYIEKTNKVYLVMTLHSPYFKYGDTNVFKVKQGYNVMENNNIIDFFQQYDITIDKYSLIVEHKIITISDNYHYEYKYNSVLQINNNTFYIDVDVIKRDHVYLSLLDTLCNVLIDDYLLK